MQALSRLHRTPLYQQHFLHTVPTDEAVMELALALAGLAADWQEVPVGAVVVDRERRVIGMGVNHTLYAHDPTAHAEIMALRDACAFMGNYRLPGSQLFVSLEPCMMCMGAILHARVQRLVYAAKDPKTGVCHSVLTHEHYAELNHHTSIEGGLFHQHSAQLLQDFFRMRRRKK